MKFGIANILTLSRLLLTPVFVGLFLAGYGFLAFVVFCFASFTDLIDGSVARFFKEASKNGAILDPIADKVLMESGFFLLALYGVIPWWFFGLAFFRDVMIVSGILFLQMKSAPLPYRALSTSKFATLLQMVVVILGLWAWWKGMSSVSFSAWRTYLIFTTTFFIALSGAQYVRIGFASLKNAKKYKSAQNG